MTRADVKSMAGKYVQNGLTGLEMEPGVVVDPVDAEGIVEGEEVMLERN